LLRNSDAGVSSGADSLAHLIRTSHFTA
jgi:hypothetical protein